jgi:hypothetical protein
MNNTDNKQIDKKELYLFVGEYVQKLVSLEEEIQDFLVRFFKEPYVLGDMVAGFNKSNDKIDKDIRNHLRELYLNHFAFEAVYTFAHKFNSFKYSLELINPAFYERIDNFKELKNYFDLISRLNDFRNYVAHQTAFRLDERFAIVKHINKTLKKTQKGKDKFEYLHKKEYNVVLLSNEEQQFIIHQMDIAVAFVRVLTSYFESIYDPLVLHKNSEKFIKFIDLYEYYFENERVSKYLNNGVFNYIQKKEQLDVLNKKLSENKSNRM